MRRRGRIIIPALADLSMAALMGLASSVFGRMECNKAINLAGKLARTIGPVIPRSRVGRKNLKFAFPEKTEEEREAILTRMWEHFGRSLVEYVHVDQTFDYDPADPEAGRVIVSGAEHFERLRDNGGPAIIFTAHLANWEMLGVCAARFGLDVAALFRPPANRFMADMLFKVRSGNMGRLIPSGRGASLELASTLDKGKIVSMLIDQRFHGGVAVPFFGRPADTNPLLAKLARQFDCPVHGARAVRLPDGRLRLEITDEIKLPRDSDGQIDVERGMAAVQRIVEGWVRENPDQWMWVHRRWRLGWKSRVERAPVSGTVTQTD